MKKMTVHTAVPYSIIIERGLINQAGAQIRAVTDATRAVIVTDSNVGPLYANKVRMLLAEAGFSTMIYTFPAGEASKRLDTMTPLFEALVSAGLTRGDIVVALGGGVTGDLAGFAAATYLRGVPYIQIPTSLLAQIDSSVGGKTGVDLTSGKNLVGSFWQPSLVLCDPDVLSTLPPRFFFDGIAEAIKYGCIKNRPLFDQIASGNASDHIDDIIFACINIKRGVVERDEREQGERMLLNFGHTFGHAIERCTHYTGMTHGEAVGVGMVMAAKAGEAAGMTEKGTAARIIRALLHYRLPTETDIPLDDLIAATASDKKRAGQKLHFVLLRELGEAHVYTISSDELRDLLAGGKGV